MLRFEQIEGKKPENNGNEGLKEKLKAKSNKEESGEPALAPAPCPDNPEVTCTKDHCDKCEKRSGCPVWE